LPYGTANIFYVFILSLFEGEEALPFVKKIPNTSTKYLNQIPQSNQVKIRKIKAQKSIIVKI